MSRQHSPKTEYAPIPDARQIAGETLGRARRTLARLEWDSAAREALEGILRVGFTLELVEVLATAYRESGRPRLASAARSGGGLTEWMPDDSPASPPDTPSSRGLVAPSAEAYAKGIASAIAYLRRIGHSGDPGVGLLFDYLGRRFQLPWARSLGHEYQSVARQQEGLRYLVRLASSKSADLPPVLRLDRIDRVVIPALHCDVRPLPEDFFASMYWSTVLGGYDLTHAVLALRWMEDLSCTTGEARWRRLREHQARQLRRHLSRSGTVDDLFVETVAMLYYLGEGATVDPRWINRILSAQQPDGGWKRSDRFRKTNDHTTFLALWALLEHARPPGARTPVFRGEPN